MQANSSSAFMPPKRSEPVIIIESGTSTRATGTRTTRAKRTRAEAEISVTAAAGTSTVSTTKPTKTRKKAKTTETQAQYAPSEMSLEQLLQAGGCAHLLSKDLLSRLNRARTQKMFVVSRETTGEYTQHFELLGTTGNVYTVVIGEKMTCDCHDFIFRRMHCKHILLVLMRVFNPPPISPAFKSTTLSKDNVKELFANSKPDPSVMVSQELKDLIQRKLHGEEPEIQGATQRSLDADCPICFESFEESERAIIIFCKVCGNNIHKACFDAWKSRCYNTVTCVYCRSEWVDDTTKNKSKGKKKVPKELMNEGYINFAREAGLSLTRDISTYSSSYPRGRRRYEDYEDYEDYD